MAKKSPHRHRIRRGDSVLVISGADKGQRGRVLRIIAEEDRVVVEGVNLVHRHIRRSQKNPQGGRVRRESPIHVSNVMVIDPSNDTPTRIGRFQKEPDKGSLGWIRMSRRTGKELGETASKQAKKKAKKTKATKKE